MNTLKNLFADIFRVRVFLFLFVFFVVVFFLIMCDYSFTARMEDKANGSVDSKRYPSKPLVTQPP